MSEIKEAISVDQLSYSYGGPIVLEDLTLHLPYGSRCLLVGANGAGKSTFLRILAGKRMVRTPVITLGQDAYNNSPDGVTYLGAEFIQNPIVHRDVIVRDLLRSMGADQHPERKAQLIELLDVNENWHMHEISDGERRRVQIMMGLLKPFKLLLQDEVTVDLDVIVRRNLLDFLRFQSDNATILYATHIFDGLGDWPTHIAHIRNGTIVKLYTFQELISQVSTEDNLKYKWDSPLLRVVEKLLKEDFLLARSHKSNNDHGKTIIDEKGENAAEFGDKFYNYWKNKN